MILFVASNAIYIAVGALFSTISNEIYAVSKNDGNKIIPKYMGENEEKLRNEIPKFALLVSLFYAFNFTVATLSFILKNISPFKDMIEPELLQNIQVSSILIILLNFPILVVKAISLFYNYFTIRQVEFHKTMRP